MKRYFTIIILLYAVISVNGQEQLSDEKKFNRYNIGFGVGMDYGGFGAKVMILALDRLEFFSAVGYNLLGLGFNGGADFRILPQKRICPYFGAMYGYNAVIKVTGAQTFKHTYYGPSFNLGLEFWSVSKDNFFNLEVLFPARSSEYYKDLSYLKDIQNIKFLSEPTPIGISIGYHFSF